VFGAFMAVFCVLMLVVFWSVIPCVWVHGAAHEEFVCEVVDELSDWDYLKVSVKF
jgi:hypothetical protein